MRREFEIPEEAVQCLQNNEVEDLKIGKGFVFDSLILFFILTLFY